METGTLFSSRAVRLTLIKFMDLFSSRLFLIYAIKKWIAHVKFYICIIHKHIIYSMWNIYLYTKNNVNNSNAYLEFHVGQG